MNSLEKISLATILLFILGSSILIRAPWVGVAPLVFFFILVVILGWAESTGRADKLKGGLLALALLYLVVVLLTVMIGNRSSGLTPAHDNVLQVEASMDYLKSGFNPYARDYFGTAMEEMREIATVTGYEFLNPALYHNLKLPFHLIFSLPFSFLSGYDQRIVYLFCLLLSGGLISVWLNRYRYRSLLLVLFFLNPLFIVFFVTGRDDIFVLSWLLLSLYLLDKKYFRLAALIFGLALASKHSAWLLTPFYVAHLYFLAGPGSAFLKKAKFVWHRFYPAPLTAAVFFLPFVLWDWPAFWEDVFLFPFGLIPNGYPINGYGLASLLVELGRLESPFVYFSSWIWLLVIALPLLAWLLRYQRQHNTVPTMFVSYGIFLLVFWFLSRFFHDNHIGFISQLLLVGYFLGLDRASASARQDLIEAS